MIRSMQTTHPFHAKLIAPFGVLGISCENGLLAGISFLPAGEPPQEPESDFALAVCQQLSAYFNDPDFRFNLPLKPAGTNHQRKVWQAMCDIPRGQTRQYGELALALHSSAQAVGQACGANPIPIVIPCHRVVSKVGIGGFAHHRDGYELDIKRWLLKHEQR
jgi:methylated-DNA-[protein]-cysteine S-methyltransferase